MNEMVKMMNHSGQERVLRLSYYHLTPSTILLCESPDFFRQGLQFYEAIIASCRNMKARFYINYPRHDYAMVVYLRITPFPGHILHFSIPEG